MGSAWGVQPEVGGFRKDQVDGLEGSKEKAPPQKKERKGPMPLSLFSKRNAPPKG